MNYFKEQPIMSLYSIILIFLGFYILLTIFDSPTIGKDAFIQMLLISLFFLLLGFPILLLVLFCIFIEIKGYIQRVLKKMKRIDNEKSKKKKEKRSYTVFTVLNIVAIVSFVLVFSGIKMMMNYMKDKPYLDNPIQIKLIDWEIERSGTIYKSSVGLSYLIVGKDEEGETHSFRIGNSSQLLSSCTDQKEVKIYYLPHTNIVMGIECK